MVADARRTMLVSIQNVLNILDFEISIVKQPEPLLSTTSLLTVDANIMCHAYYN